MTIEWRGVMRMPSKDLWFRQTEREHESTPILKLNDGSYIETDQIIIRAGYLYQPLDMPMNLLRQQGYEHVRNYMNTGKKAWAYPGGFVPYFDGEKHTKTIGKEKFTIDDIKYLEDAFYSTDDDLYKNLYYQLRRVWLKRIKEEYWNNHDKEERGLVNYKTFYYVKIDKRQFQVYGYKVKHCGKYYAGGSRGYYSPDDYDPPFLATSVQQSLYHIGYVTNEAGKQEYIYVHPLDCNQNKESYM